MRSILITGGHGFIGSHVAKRFFGFDEYFVKVVDVVPESEASIAGPICHEFIQGNLCDLSVCIATVRGVNMVLHFAANMGGMGTIHDDNGASIYEQNHTMTLNLLKASNIPGATVTHFFYASSACVYPEALQTDCDVSLREVDVFTGGIPQPQGLYGLEKLSSELLLVQYTSKINIRIARFHNIFGPGGSWNNGREKAPAAFLRKALVCRHLIDESQPVPNFEIWGDGCQRRSFLFIDDAVDAIIKLLSSTCSTPVNIGSDNAVSIRELAEMALHCVGTRANFIYDSSRPVGVFARNSNNDASRLALDWAPSTSLQEGMEKTCDWIQVEMDTYLAHHEKGGTHKYRLLQGLLSSKLVSLEAERLTFAILLPITSRGSTEPDACLLHLRNFVQSLKDTTWRDTYPAADQVFRYVIYLAVDADDHFLCDDNKAYQTILDLGVPSTQIRQLLNSAYPKGHVCKLWRDCARQAYDDGCDYSVLMGDDVTLKDEGWMRKSHSTFSSLSRASGLPHGLGCVAFTDESFPGMPTFPIIHRMHMEIFGGEVIPDTFTNQDGDPYLFQLYRRWGTSVMFPCRLTNAIGGLAEARYEKRRVVDWSLGPLVYAERVVSTYLQTHHRYGPSQTQDARKITLDVIIPCYRVNIAILSAILSLKAPSTTSVNYIIIIDSPASPHIPTLLSLFSINPNVRIRVNRSNLGASYSRNRGLSESSADWVHFLDDDVIPSPDLLFAISDAIRVSPSAAGFVCNTQFPPANSIFTTAVRLSGVTYFWDIATKMKTDVPWGVTANLVARRVLLPHSGRESHPGFHKIPLPTKFSLSYPKTGGGEDIDYCLTQRATHISLFRGANDPSCGEEYPGFPAAPQAVVTHPWWDNGKRSYWRFHRWSIGDGHLVQAYPELSYRDYAPNSAECFLMCFIFLSIGVAIGSPRVIVLSVEVTGCVILANILHDGYRHMILHPERTNSLKVTQRIRRNVFLWVLAVMESALIRMFSELGRLRGLLEKREWRSVGKRFDWFVGRAPGNGPRTEERRNSVERVGLAVAVFVTLGGFRG